MRQLTNQEIEKLASRTGVRRIAVENFLSSMPTDLNIWQQLGNLAADAKSYKWNTATVSAITKGIRMAYK